MRTEVAIVGAGITGLSVAWHLLERGERSLAIYEREGVGAGASGVQPGGVRQQWGTRLNVAMARASLAFYRELGECLQPRVDPGFHACGYLFAASLPETLERLRSEVAMQNELGVPSRILTPAEAAEVVPGLTSEAIVGAAYCAEDGFFGRPQGVVEAFAEAAQVVVAKGVDAPALLGPLAVELPIVAEPRFLFLGDPIRERLLEPLVVAPDRRFAAKQLADGRLLAGDLSEQEDDSRRRRRVRECLSELLPRLELVPLPCSSAASTT